VTFINKVGLEIEGGWDGTPGLSPFEDAVLFADGSIDGQTRDPNEGVLETTHVGEVISTPLARPEVEEWLKVHWPNATNRTCGYHIHVSLLSKKSYVLLTRKGFMLRLRKKFLALGEEVKLPSKHPFWKRMSGENTFCQMHFDAGKQINIKVKRHNDRTRYGFLNFAYNVHGTLELRGLPTFRDFPIALTFTNCFLDFVEEYLTEQSSVQWKRSASLAA
jgi:hypothetical protein